MKLNYIAFGLLLFVFACGQQNSNNQPEASKPKTNFEKMLDAHGSLEKWNSYGTLEFDIYSSSDTVHHIIDLKSREELATTDKYKVFFGKENLWVAPDKEAYGKDEPQFYKNLWFYFFSLPFVAADQGVNQFDLESKTMGDVQYNGIKLTFGENVGDSPDDQYLLWLNAKSNQLEWINYSVTYWNEENAEKYSAIKYQEWQTVDGLTVPRLFSGHKWQGDTIGDERYRFVFDNVKFSESRPDPSLFTQPEASYTEQYQ